MVRTGFTLARRVRSALLSLTVSGRVAVVLLVGAVACAIASQVARLAGVEPFVTLFAVTSEQNVPTWYAVILLVLAALAMFLVASLVTSRRDRWAWTVMGAVLLLLSLDELASLHERLKVVGDAIVGDAGGVLHFSWVVPGLVVALVPVAAVVHLARRLPRPLGVELLCGVGLILLGALGFEMLGGVVLTSLGPGHAYSLTAGVEEFLEMLGAITLLHATVRALDLRRTGRTWSVGLAGPRLVPSSDARGSHAAPAGAGAGHEVLRPAGPGDESTGPLRRASGDG